MDRKVRQVDLGGGRYRYLVTIRDVLSDPADVGRRRLEFLRELVDGLPRGLLACGPHPFERMRLRHDGEAWVAELEAEDPVTEGSG